MNEMLYKSIKVNYLYLTNDIRTLKEQSHKKSFKTETVGN